MAKDNGAPRHEPQTDPNPSRRVIGEVMPEQPQPEEEDVGIEIDNAIERPREGQPGQRSGKAN